MNVNIQKRGGFMKKLLLFPLLIATLFACTGSEGFSHA